jgi:hypothetical protein
MQLEAQRLILSQHRPDIPTELLCPSNPGEIRTGATTREVDPASVIRSPDVSDRVTPSFRC